MNSDPLILTKMRHKVPTPFADIHPKSNWSRRQIVRKGFGGLTLATKPWRLSALRMVLADTADSSPRLGAWRVSSAADWHSLDRICFTTCSSRVVSLGGHPDRAVAQARPPTEGAEEAADRRLPFADDFADGVRMPLVVHRQYLGAQGKRKPHGDGTGCCGGCHMH